jgi:hypothetical protein
MTDPSARDARARLSEVWDELRLRIEQAEAFEASARLDPSTLDDPKVQAYTRWHWLFEPELTDVRTVKANLARGARLSPNEIYAAVLAGEKLLDIVNEGEQVAREESEPDEDTAELERSKPDRGMADLERPSPLIEGPDGTDLGETTEMRRHPGTDEP